MAASAKLGAVHPTVRIGLPHITDASGEQLQPPGMASLLLEHQCLDIYQYYCYSK